MTNNSSSYNKLRNKYAELLAKYSKKSQDYNDFIELFNGVLMPILKFDIDDLERNKTDEEILKYCTDRKIDISMFLSLVRGMYNKGFLGSSHCGVDSSQKNEESEYKVGYKNPPLETRFQKGNKGNKKGRKSRRNMNIKDLLLEELDKPIEVAINGVVEIIKKREFVSIQIINKILKAENVPRNTINLLERLDSYSITKAIFSKKDPK